jgi:hypothetical protein
MATGTIEQGMEISSERVDSIRGYRGEYDVGLVEDDDVEYGRHCQIHVPIWYCRGTTMSEPQRVDMLETLNPSDL